MQCLNIKNKEVAALLKEYTEILGNEDAAYYVISENNGYGLDKAPNGEPSKLFSDLIDHFNGDKNKAIVAKAKTYTDSFRNWFGDWLADDKTNVSKVIDENGEPLIVYTGTLKDFDTFDSKYSRTASKGFFFTVDKEVAKSYGNVKEVFLNIKNLKKENNELSSLDLENDKYDGISYFHHEAEALVVWNPNQIKSVENEGTFSRENDSIYKTSNQINHDKEIRKIEQALKDIDRQLNYYNYISANKMSFPTHGEAVKYIKDNNIDAVAYVFQNRGRYRIAKRSRKFLDAVRRRYENNIEQIKEDLYSRYNGFFGEDERLSDQMLEEQESKEDNYFYTKGATRVEDTSDYIAWLSSITSEIVFKPWEDEFKLANQPVTEVTNPAEGTDKTLVERLFKNKSKVTAREIIDNIEATNPALKPLLDVLRKAQSNLLDNTQIIYLDKGAHDSGASALYYSATQNIVVFGDAGFKHKGGLADASILHEIIHKLTISNLCFNPVAKLELSKILQSARDQLSKKLGRTWQELVNDPKYNLLYYGLTNEYEFLAELFSYSKFANELASLDSVKDINSKEPLILKSIVDWVLRVLGITKKNNLYKQSMGLLEDIMFNTNGTQFGISDGNAYLDSLTRDNVFLTPTLSQNPKEIKDLLNKKSENISFNPTSHTYTNITTGEIYTPVSTVKELHGYGVDTSNMSEEIKEYGSYTAKIGTTIHDYVHHILTGEPLNDSEIKLSDNAKKSISKLLERVLGNSKVISSEQLIANDSAKIAGTLDLLIQDENGKIILLDFKSKARNFKGKSKYGFDYYFSNKFENEIDNKPTALQHDYQLSLYKRILELTGVKVDGKGIIPLEYDINELGEVTNVWIPPLDYAESNGVINHRINNALENEINETVLSNDTEAITNELQAEALTKQSKIVDNILTILKKQYALHIARGYKTKSEITKSFIDRLNSMDEAEVIVAYIKRSVDMLKPLIDTYNELIELEKNGTQNVWDLRKLKNWKNYAESFQNLLDIRDYLFLNPKTLDFLGNSKQDVLDALNTAINYKNALENAYVAKGEKLWSNWLIPFTTRIEAEYRRKAEKEYKKANKGKVIDLNDMNKYIEKYITEHRAEIDLKSRDLVLQQSKIAIVTPISGISRWLDTIFESSDTIVGAMARAYHTTWMEANDEFNNTYNELVSLTEELEKAYPELKNNPEKLYDFMIDDDNNETTLVSKLSKQFLQDYAEYKKRIQSDDTLTDIQKANRISDWLNKNAPITDKKALNNEKVTLIEHLFENGNINEDEKKALLRNETKSPGLKLSWARLVERGDINEATADYLRVAFNKLNWQYRKPDKNKYKNKKFEALEQLREKNPNDIKVRFYDFINNLSEYGDSFVPDRFKLNGRLPGISKTAREQIITNGLIETAKTAAAKEFTVRADDSNRGMQMTDELDRPIKFVPIYFTNKLQKKDQSYDIATIYKEWFRSVNNYKYINDILPQLEYTKMVVENRKTVATDNAGNPIQSMISRIANRSFDNTSVSYNALMKDENLIAQLNSWFNQVVYGETDRNLGTVAGIDIAKAMNLFQKYTSLKIMGVNFVSMFNNALMAEVQQIIETSAKQYVTAESYHKASVAYTQDLPNILGDIGSRKITSLTNLLNEYFGVFTDYNTGSMLENSRFKKLANISTLYFTTNVGEHEAQSRFLIAALMEKRALDKDGKDIGSMYDYFGVEDGKLVFDKDNKVANFSKKDRIAFGQHVTAILRKMHGNYANYSKVALQQHGLGKMALMFRKWIYTTAKRRFSKEYYDEYGQTFSKGYYRDGAAFYYNKVRGFFERMSNEAKALEYAEKADWDTMTEDEKSNVRRFTTEFAMLAIITALSSLIGLWEPEDENSELILNHIDYQLFRLSTDITFYFSPKSFMQIVQSPIPSSSVFKSFSSFTDALLHPTAKFEKGDWKGEYKIKKRAFDLLPIVRQIYRLRNIDDERKLLSLL